MDMLDAAVSRSGAYSGLPPPQAAASPEVTAFVNGATPPYSPDSATVLDAAPESPAGVDDLGLMGSLGLSADASALVMEQDPFSLLGSFDMLDASPHGMPPFLNVSTAAGLELPPTDASSLSSAAPLSSGASSASSSPPTPQRRAPKSGRATQPSSKARSSQQKSRARGPAAAAAAAAPSPESSSPAASGGADDSSALQELVQEMEAIEKKLKTQAGKLDAKTERALKQQRRMLKNRISASESRKRKKEHLTLLERKVEEDAREKEAMRKRLRKAEEDNERLRLQLEQALLQLNSAGLPMPPAAAGHAAPRPAGFAASTSFKAGATCLLACLLCFALFSNPASGPATLPFAPSNSRAVAPLGPGPEAARAAAGHFGRTLKSTDLMAMTAEAERGGGARRRNGADDESRAVATLQGLQSPVQPPAPLEHPNLDKWLRQHHAKLRAHLNTTVSGGSNAAAPSSRRQVGTGLAPRGRGLPEHDDESLGGVSPVYRLDDESRPALFRTVQRRSDSSYIFCTEVQVVSQAVPGDGEKPRLSVIMPTPHSKSGSTTVGGNGSSAVDLVQVDCEVISTKVIPATNMTAAAVRPPSHA